MVLSSTDGLTFQHLYTDADGETHFAEKDFAFEYRQDIEGRGGITVSELRGVTGAAIYRLKQGTVEDWHTAPRKQFGFVIQGQADITASDGQVLRLAPGSIILIDDTTGKGHITAGVGDEDHVVLMVPVGE